MELVEDVEADPKGGKERTLRVFEVEDQALTYARSLSAYNCGHHRQDLVHASVSDRVSHFWKKDLT